MRVVEPAAAFQGLTTQAALGCTVPGLCETNVHSLLYIGGVERRLGHFFG